MKKEINADLCHVRSADSRKRPLCAGCRSPYKAKVMYRPDCGTPEAPLKDSARLEHKMVAQFRKQPPPPRAYPADDVDDDEIDLTLPAGSTASQSRDGKSSGRGKGTLPLLGGALLKMADSAAKLKREGIEIDEIRKALGGIAEAKYKDLIRFSRFSREFRAIIVRDNISLNAALVLCGFPEELREVVWDRVRNRGIKMRTVEIALARSKYPDRNLRDVCSVLKFPWPDTLDADGKPIK